MRITGLREPRQRLHEWFNGFAGLVYVEGSVKEVGVMGVVEREKYVQPRARMWEKPEK